MPSSMTRAGLRPCVLLAAAVLAVASPAQLAGTVYSDYNSNGQRDSLAELPVAGVTVTAVDAAGGTVSGVTDAFGFYLIFPSNGRQLVTFTNLPAGAYPVASGSGSNAATRFVVAPFFPVDLGINVPEDHAQNNPKIASPLYVNGDPSFPAVGGVQALASIDYDRTGAAANDASAGEIGACFGAAWHRGPKKLYVASTIRRHAGLTAAGTGAIFEVDYSGGSPAAALFANLNSYPGVNTGADPHSGLPSDPFVANHDPAAFDAVGKVGLGGIEMSEDDRTLFVVSLGEKKLYRLNVGPDGTAPASIDGFDIPNPGCVGGEHRPFAVKCRRGKVYVGVVCDGGSSTGNADLSATVYELAQNADPIACNANPGSCWTPVLSFPLNYAKGYSVLNFVDTNKWNGWITQWPTPYTNSPIFYTLPQPMLTDLDFETDGSMILGFADRFGMQVGSFNFQPASGDITVYQGGAGGDLLRAGKVANGWQIESNGQVAGLASLGVGNGQGPGGGEFYNFDFFTATHEEIALGAVLSVPGKNETVSTTYDQTTFFEGGYHWFSSLNAVPTGIFTVYSDNNIGVGGKVSGIGDVEPLLDPAPLQIGNLVWIDSDQDGAQDAGEPGVGYVTVNLRDCSGNFVASTKTDAYGNYLFTDANVPGGLLRNACYLVCLDNPNDYAAMFAGPLTGRTPTLSNAGTNDELDSDGVVQPNGANCALVMTGDHGRNDHSVDFGFVCTGTFASITPLTPGCGFPFDPILTGSAPIAGTVSTLQITSGLPFAHTWIFASEAPVTPTLLQPSGCTIFVDMTLSGNLFLLYEGFSDAMGGVKAEYYVPNFPGVDGNSVVIQGSMWGAGGPINDDSVTNGLLAVIGCP